MVRGEIGREREKKKESFFFFVFFFASFFDGDGDAHLLNRNPTTTKKHAKTKTTAKRSSTPRSRTPCASRPSSSVSSEFCPLLLVLSFETARWRRGNASYFSLSHLSFSLIKKTGGIVVIHSKQQLYLYEDATHVMRQAALGYGAGEEAAAAGSAALLPAEGGGGGGAGGAGGGAAAAAAPAAAAAADFAALGGLGGLGPHALGGWQAARGIVNRGINLAEGDALVRVF